MQLGGIRRKSFVVAMAVGLAISGAAIPVQQTHASDLAQRNGSSRPGNGGVTQTNLQLPNNTQVTTQSGGGNSNSGTNNTGTGTGTGTGNTTVRRPGTQVVNNPNTVNTVNNQNNGGQGGNNQNNGGQTGNQNGQGGNNGSQNNVTGNQNTNQNGGNQNNNQGGQNGQGGNGGGPGNGTGGGNGPGNGQGGGNAHHNIVQDRGNRNSPQGFNSHLWVQNPNHLFVHVPHYVQFVPPIFHVYHGPFFGYEPDWYFYRHISFPQAFVVYVEEPVLVCTTEYYFFEPEGVFYCFVAA